MKKQTRGCEGIGCVGRPNFLDSMRILKPIWEENEGKYARVGGIKRYWKKANILPVSWECYINNYVGSSYVLISMNSINKDDFDNICNLFETVSVKAK